MATVLRPPLVVRRIVRPPSVAAAGWTYNSDSLYFGVQLPLVATPVMEPRKPLRRVDTSFVLGSPNTLLPTAPVQRPLTANPVIEARVRTIRRVDYSTPLGSFQPLVVPAPTSLPPGVQSVQMRSIRPTPWVSILSQTTSIIPVSPPDPGGDTETRYFALHKARR